MKILAHLPVKETLKMSLRSHECSRVKATDGKSYKVSGLKSFGMHGCKCVRCGREGNVVIVWIDNGGGQHIDLFAMHQGYQRPILMNRDHIIPRSKKGPNSEWNYQTMCVKCNTKKGNRETPEDVALAEFRSHWRKVHVFLHDSYWIHTPRFVRSSAFTTLFIKFKDRHLHKVSLFVAKLTHIFA